MLTIKKNGNKFIVEWEGMDIVFEDLRKALIFVETIFKFIAMDVNYEEIVVKADNYDKIMSREKESISSKRYME